jgi:hypothetical protein
MLQQLAHVLGDAELHEGKDRIGFHVNLPIRLRLEVSAFVRGAGWIGNSVPGPTLGDRSADYARARPMNFASAGATLSKNLRSWPPSP